MTTQLPDLYTALFDALEALDQQLDGYGLYAIRGHQKILDLPHPPLVREWEAAIRPTLQQVGGQPKCGTFMVTLPDKRRVGIEVFKLSSVKLRKYAHMDQSIGR